MVGRFVKFTEECDDDQSSITARNDDMASSQRHIRLGTLEESVIRSNVDNTQNVSARSRNKTEIIKTDHAPIGMLNEANLRSLGAGKGTGAVIPQTVDSARQQNLKVEEKSNYSDAHLN